MIYRLLKNLALLVSLGIGLVGCSGLLGSSNTSMATNSSQTLANAAGKTSYPLQTQSHHSSLFSTGVASELRADLPVFMGGDGSDFWQHLRNDFQIPPEDDKPQVQAQINWFMHNRDYLDHTLRRGAPYMFYILQQVEKRNLPGELVLLPVLESDYDPTAISSAGAVGMWQLMTPTARDLGLKQDFWFDGKRDIYASTNAALDQLAYLQSYFGGDWLLALSAYDAGDGAVQNAIKHSAERGAGSDFWSLHLPKETEAYAPRLLALASIIRDPGKYNITLPPVSNEPYLTQVDIGAPISLQQAAQLAGLTVDQIKKLNPGFSRMTTDPNGPYKLMLPIDRVAMFKEQLANIPSLPVTTWGRYKVQRGDSLNSIARHYNTTVAELIEANHLRSRLAPVGKVIMIPTGIQSVTPHVDDTDDNSSSSPSSSSPSSSLDNNDAAQQTATSDTSNNGASVVSTVDASDTSNPQSTDTPASSTGIDALSTVPNTNAPTTVSQTRATHTVRKNETLAMLAKRYGVKTSDLMRWNKLRAGRPLKPGEKLIVSAANSQSQLRSQLVVSSSTHRSHVHAQSLHVQNTSKFATHRSAIKSTIRPDHYVVRAGDNISTIAKRLGVKSANLAKWNHLAANADLQPGDRLVVH